MMKLLLSLLGLFAAVAFCAFGFLASFEPSDTPGEFLAFRVGYAVIGLGCIVGMVLLIVNDVRRKSLAISNE